MNLPGFVQIEPVGQCNLACRMCPVVLRGDGSPGKPPAFMHYAAFCRLIDQFAGVRELHLQGLGEPLLHPRIFDMVRYAAGRGIEVSTNTNLTALSPRRADECVASGLARMHVSLDAAVATAMWQRCSPCRGRSVTRPAVAPRPIGRAAPGSNFAARSRARRAIATAVSTLDTAVSRMTSASGSSSRIVRSTDNPSPSGRR